MARSLLLVLLAAALLAVRTSAIRADQQLSELRAASTCADLKEPKACDDDEDCTWCLGKGDIGTACYAVHMARMLPKRFFSCDNDPRSVVAEVQGVSECVGLTDSKECDELNACTWCVGQGNVGTACYPVAMARALPKRYFMCDNDARSLVLPAAAKEKEQEEQEEEQEELKGVSECVGVDDSATCNARPGCTWCVGQGSGTDCYPVAAARMLPKRFFTCDNDSRS